MRRTRRPKPAVQDALAVEAASVAPAPRKRSFPWRHVGMGLLSVLVALIVMALSVGLGGYYGRYRGERDRQARRLEEADRHYRAGLELLNAGHYELAIAEFECALELNPAHPYAPQGIAEAQVGIASRPTPTVEVYRIASSDLYQEAVAHYQAGEWEEAAAKFIQLRALDATYEAQAVEEMLFNSLYHAGLALMEEDRLEEGIFYLDQAVALRPLDEGALTQRSLAVKYLTALGYWGVDWDMCIKRFEELYAIAPNYKDVFRRLYQAHVAYGDSWYARGEMCPAEEQYALAQQLISDPTVTQKRSEAEQICQMATPTPIVPLEGGGVLTLTELPQGFATGRLAYPAYNPQAGVYDIYALFTDKRLVRMASAADQPCWMPGGGALGYRDLSALGISLVAADGSASRLVVAGAGLAWPTFSPDGNRMAYAAQDVAGTWQIYVVSLNGAEEGPRVLAAGQGPAWGPNGWLAWTGCDAGGDCGIFVDNPDDSRSPTRLSANINDIALSWSPDGGNIAYMSNHTGNWEVYLVSTSGGFARLTEDPAADGLPAWAPDGSGIAFVSNRDGAWGVYLMGPNGENPHKILDLGPNMPNWTMQRLSWGP